MSLSCLGHRTPDSQDPLRVSIYLYGHLIYCANFGTLKAMRKIEWNPAAKATAQSFSQEIKREMGVLLLALQRGHPLGMPQSRKMPSIHPSAFELRIRDKSGIYRVFYVFLDQDKILIPHVFTKKTQRTPKKEIETAKKRLRRLIDEIK